MAGSIETGDDSLKRYIIRIEGLIILCMRRCSGET